MGRKILAVACGLISAWGLIIIGLMLGTDATPFRSPNLEFMTRAQIIAYNSSQPNTVYATLLIMSVIGAFFGGYIVTNMSRRESPGLKLTMIVAAFLILGGLVNFLVLLPGQPAWLMASTLLCYIPVTVLGHKAADALV